MKKRIFLLDSKRGTGELVKFLQARAVIVDDISQAELIVVCGGDGTMLDAIGSFWDRFIPFTGFNFGHIGFLLNDPSKEVLDEILTDKVEVVSVRLLKARLFDEKGKDKGEVYAFNDIYFERTSVQTVNLRVAVNGKILFNPLIGDGVIVATAAGSTAYNAAAGGVIVPLGIGSLILTGICPAVFHRWRSAQLPAEAKVTLEALDFDRRPVRLVVDGREIRGVVKVEAELSDRQVQLVFAASQKFKEKVLSLQMGTFPGR